MPATMAGRGIHVVGDGARGHEQPVRRHVERRQGPDASAVSVVAVGPPGPEHRARGAAEGHDASGILVASRRFQFVRDPDVQPAVHREHAAPDEEICGGIGELRRLDMACFAARTRGREVR